jgi:phosphatidylglycerophosphatase A
MIKPYTLIATWFGSGFMTPASGTWGTLASLPICLMTVSYSGHWGVFIASMTLFCVGLWVTHLHQKNTGKHDPSEVVIDETLGMMIASIPLLYLFNWQMILACFVLFRLFDAVKIGPVGWLDKNIDGAMGVMIDDVAAGLMATICVLIYLAFYH